MSANTLPSDETVPNDWPELGEQPYTGPVTGQQLAALDVLEEIALAQDVQVTTELPPYTGPMTGDQLGLLGTGERGAIEVAEREMAPRGRVQARARRGVPRLVSIVLRRPLAVILIAQAALSLRLVWSNTAFMDEALYLSAGHWEIAHLLHGAHAPQYQTYFSGAPVIYPVLGAMADGLGGLAAARLLSCLFMVGATALCYGTGTRLFGRRAGIAAAAVYAALGPVEFLGAFATYDAMALFLLTLSAFLAIRAGGPQSEFLLIGAALVLAVADATKYATALWDPIVIVLVILAGGRGWRAGSWRGARFAGYLAAPIAAGLRVGGHSYVQGVMYTTVARQAGGQYASAWEIAQDVTSWIGPVVLLAGIGVIVAWRGGPRRRLLLGTLLLAALLAPAHQAQIHILTSLHKHVAFGAWFGAIAAGYVLAKAAEVNARKGWRIGFVTAGLIAMAGIPQAAQQFGSWADVSQMMPVLAAGVRQAGCPCLVMQSNVAGYYTGAAPSAFIGPYYFAWRPSPGGRLLTDFPAYQAAIARGYFRVAETDPDEGAAVYDVTSEALARSPLYRLVWSERVRWGWMRVWERAS